MRTSRTIKVLVIWNWNSSFETLQDSNQCMVYITLKWLFRVTSTSPPQPNDRAWPAAGVWIPPAATGSPVHCVHAVVGRGRPCGGRRAWRRPRHRRAQAPLNTWRTEPYTCSRIHSAWSVGFNAAGRSKIEIWKGENYWGQNNVSLSAIVGYFLFQRRGG